MTIRTAREETGHRRQSCRYELYHVDAFDRLSQCKPQSIHAVVTDPPYGLLEYKPDQLEKMKNGRGGVWRIPPSFDGCQRSPLPRFTVLTKEDKEELRAFFGRLASRLMPVLAPGAHVFIATNPLVSYLVYEPFVKVGFKKRGEIIRVIQTLRGGDRPKNAHREFEEISVMPRSCWEPWGLFRKPCEGRVQDNLRKWGTGGAAEDLGGAAFQGPGVLISRRRSRARDSAASVAQAATFPAAIGEGRAPSGQRCPSGPVHGLRVHHSGGGGVRVEKHRT